MTKNIYNPKDLSDETEKQINEIPNADFFSKSDKRNKDLMENWCAAVFGIGYSEYIKDCEIRVNLTQDSSADFILIVDGNEFDFQITETLYLDRLRGKEYKENDDSPKPYRPAKGQQEGADWIYEKVENKVNKYYSDSETLSLLIYADFNGAYRLDRNNIQERLRSFKDKFYSIWIIANSQIGSVICSIFSNSDIGEINAWKRINMITKIK